MEDLPEMIGPYKPLKEIGRGGHAIVYLAQDSSEQKQFAVKVLQPPFVRDLKQRKRFEQEANIISKLQHPNIIRVFNFGIDSYKELIFIAMEYVPGETLHDRLDNPERLSRCEAMDIIRQIGEALSYVHEQPDKIIHRDINPKNILLELDEDQKLIRAVLTDFGLVKLLSVDSSLTGSDNMPGTPAYMAPEQSDNKTLTLRTDLYALAVVFFEMLAGQHPFEANSPIEFMNKHLNEPLPHLSKMAPRIGSFFDEILIKATAKNPSDRYESVSEFIQALEEANEEAEEDKQRVKDALKFVKTAQDYIQNDNYDPTRALVLVEIAWDKYPGLPDTLRVRGKIRLKQGQLSKALDDYRDAYEKECEPFFPSGLDYLAALSQVAEIFWQRVEHSKAFKQYEVIKQIWLTDQRYPKKSAENAMVGETCEQARVRLIEHHEEEIDIEKQAIVSLKHDHNATDFEGIIQHYQKISEIYRELVSLAPQDNSKLREQRKNLEDLIRARHDLANRVLKGPDEPNYEEAIKQYNAIHELEEIGFRDVVRKLGIAPQDKINELSRNADYKTQYADIGAMLERGEFDLAKLKLEEKFIKPGYYYKRSLSWYEAVLYAKEKGYLPPNWNSEAKIESLNRCLLNICKYRIDKRKNFLQLWSNTAQVIEQVRKSPITFAESIDGIEKSPKAESYGDTLQTLKSKLEDLHLSLQNLDQAVAEIETWGQKTDEIEVNLKEADSIQTTTELLNQTLDQIDQQLNISVVWDVVATWWEILTSGSEIGMTLDQLKFDLLTQENTLLSQQIEVTKQSENSLRQELDSLKQGLRDAEEKLRRQHEISKYIISISLLPAVVIGGVIGVLFGIIAPDQVQNLPALIATAVVAVLVLVACFIYYYLHFYRSPHLHS